MLVPVSEQDISLVGKSGETMRGKIYTDKNAVTTYDGEAIVCLTNSILSDNKWHHHMNSIYCTNDVNKAMDHFKERDDISHMILIPHNPAAFSEKDQVDDLIRNYIHGS